MTLINNLLATIQTKPALQDELALIDYSDLENRNSFSLLRLQTKLIKLLYGNTRAKQVGRLKTKVTYKRPLIAAGIAFTGTDEQARELMTLLFSKRRLNNATPLTPSEEELIRVKDYTEFIQEYLGRVTGKGSAYFNTIVSATSIIVRIIKH